MYRVVELFGHDRDDGQDFESIERAAESMARLASEAICHRRPLQLVLEGPNHAVIQSVAVSVFPH